VTLRTLPVPLKVLATCFLMTIGVAYLCALAYLYLMDVEPHSKHGLGIIQAVITKYYGNRGGSRLESALQGSMGVQATLSEKQQIVQWLRNGAPESEFSTIQPILIHSCIGCHSPESGLQIPPFTSYAQVSPYTSIDVGESIKSLVRVSHIHLFGMSFIFLLTGLVFALSQTSHMFRSVLIAIPFLAIWIDIASWWLTKYEPAFAYTVIIGGLLMGLALAGQIAVSFYEMWFIRVPR